MYTESVKIYVLIDPRDNQIRYVGKTHTTLGRRLCEHCRTDRIDTSRKGRWIAKLLRMGLRPIIETIQTVDSESWQKAEQYWIGYYRDLGCELTNGTLGGDGGNSPTPEAIAKLIQSKTGVTRPPFSDVWKQRMSESHRSRTHCKRGHEFTTENTRFIHGNRWCRECDAMRSREYRQRQKQIKIQSALHGDMKSRTEMMRPVIHQ